MKIRPNLIDIVEIKRDIDINIFKNTSNRVNIILGLLIIFIVLLFIYFGIRNRDKTDIEEIKYNYNMGNVSVEDEYDDDGEEYEIPIMYRDNAYNLSLM